MQSLNRWLNKYSLPLFLLSCILTFIILFFGSEFELTAKVGDTKLYECYARLFWQGNADTVEVCKIILPPSVSPFSLLPYEYPMFSLLLFSLPLVFPFVAYQYVFAYLVFLAILGVGVFLYTYKKSTAFLFLFFLCLGAAPTAFIRYDFFPSALVLFTCFAVSKKRFSLSYLLLFLATLLKLYPIILFPLLFITEQLSLDTKSLLIRFRRCVSIGVLLLFFLLLPLVMRSEKNPYSFLLNRPTQLESAQATGVWIHSIFTKTTLCLNYSYNSVNLVTSSSCKLLGPFTLPPAFISWLYMGLFILGYGSILFFLYKTRLTFFTASFLTLILLLATQKIFSPQYLLWVLPFFPFFSIKSRFFFLFTIISYLTFLIFPYMYSTDVVNFIDTPLPAMQPILLLIGARNSLLLILFGILYHYLLTRTSSHDIRVLDANIGRR